MAKKSRDKGKRGEREACEVLRPIFPDVKRTAMQSRGGGEQPDLANTPGWWVEVGIGQANPATKWEQASADSRHDPLCYAVGHTAECPLHDPIALTRRDRGAWLVTMSLADFRRLIDGDHERVLCACSACRRQD